MNKSIKIRQITDGAIIVAIYALFLTISRITGAMLEYEVFFILPVPIALFCFKYDWKIGIIPSVATFLLSIFLCSNPFGSLVYILPALLIGCLQGGVFAKRNIKIVYIILISTILVSISEVLSTFVMAKVLGIENIFEEIHFMVEKIALLAENLGINKVDSAFVESLMNGLIPSIIIILSLIESTCSYMIFLLIVNRGRLFKYEDKKPKQIVGLNSFHWSYGLLYLVISIAAVISMFFFKNLYGVFYYVALVIINLFIISSLIYVYFGFQLGVLYLSLNKKKGLIVLLFILVFIFPIVLIILGLLDNFLHLKKKIIDQFIKENNRSS
ncbi:MAG: DUF2232 domain-containing protein [Bacillales bacterium]|nr:DUF2232 domain-containing protein [Bacillales bacterium]